MGFKDLEKSPAKIEAISPATKSNTKVDSSTFYKRLKQPEFKEELNRQREAVASKAFGILSQSLTKAVEVLAKLPDRKDDRLKRLAAKDVVEYFIKHKEYENLLQRLEAIEKQLANNKSDCNSNQRR